MTGLNPWRLRARPEQLEPRGDWVKWLVLAGRGWGKSLTIVEWANEQALKMPGSIGHIVASTASDTRDVLVDGPSGFLRLPDPPQYESSKRRLTWRNGSRALLFSADEPNRLRGPQCHWAIADELAAWRYPDAWDQLLLGLRLGTRPRVAIATTPRPTPIIKELVKDATCHVTRGSTFENRANLAATFLDQIVTKYEGTRLGRQELNAELLEDVLGALWTRGNLDQHRVTTMPDFVRIVVAIDPAVTAEETSDETGIVAAGLGVDGHYYVMEDKSLRASPDTWASVAVNLYHDLSADRIIAEVNNGGDMVGLTVRTVDKSVSFRAVHASRGKRTRAEPIAALYEQGKVHHVGSFARLEDQLCEWQPGIDDSPDRLDALVWAVSDLLVRVPPKPARSRQG
jgi:phage terminase large subunit-like protein